MKIKLKNILFENFYFTKNKQLNGNIINIKYLNDSLEFQTPKVIIDSFIKENEKEYILLKIIGTEACNIFCSKIKELEEYFNKILKNKDYLFENIPMSAIKTIFEDNTFIIKIPFKKEHLRVYTKDNLVNYNFLKEGMNVICLTTLDKLWINKFNEPTYYLTVKEIMIM